jgi:hypothetical protein
MRVSGLKQNRFSHVSVCRTLRILPLAVALLTHSAGMVNAQSMDQESLSRQIQKLTQSLASTQAQLMESQRQVNEIQRQLSALQQQMALSQPNTASSSTPSVALSSSAPQSQPADAASDIQDLRDRQAMEESQIATHEVTKVESESKFPVRITGLLLMNAFVNKGAVDVAAAPTVALPGSGSMGASVRQTVLGLDARGPHLLGASSYADVRVDFDGVPQSGSSAAYSGSYSANPALMRLRTAHAGLQWDHTLAYFSLDRPIVSPDAPTSLTAVAEPALAWSGNLWTWNPQVGMTQQIPVSASRLLQLQAALIDVGDGPLSPASYASAGSPPSGAELSRRPGVEVRVALLGSSSNEERRNHFGLGGYFAPHRSPAGGTYDAWASTADARFLLPARLELTGSFYRGLALGGLGGGAFKDFAYSFDAVSGEYYVRPLDDVGGWAQLKERINERVELNGAFGTDDAFASELRRYAVSGGTMYQNLSRNRTYAGNVILRPSAYLLFSLEYRHLISSPVLSLPAASNIIGLGAGYKF